MIKIDQEAEQELVKDFTWVLRHLGLNVKENEHLKETPERMAKMYLHELCKSMYEKPPEIKTFELDLELIDKSQMITVKDIPFYSLCAHHFLPFFGKVTIGYIPHNRIVGLSKFARVVDYFARKPQVQESMTKEIINYLNTTIKPIGIGVYIEGRHLCTEMRGAERSSHMITTALEGNFYTHKGVKEEFLRSVK